MAASWGGGLASNLPKTGIASLRYNRNHLHIRGCGALLLSLLDRRSNEGIGARTTTLVACCDPQGAGAETITQGKLTAAAGAPVAGIQLDTERRTQLR